MEKQDRRIRVTIVQPALPKYRIPVFRELAARPGLDLQVAYGEVAGLSNVEANGFKAIATRRWEVKVAGRLLMVHGAEWKYCTRYRSDVVVLRWSARSILSILGLLRARMNGVGVVLWGHGYSKSEKGWWRVLRNWFARKADAIVFYDPRTRERFVSEGWNPNNLFVAINSLDNREIDAARQHWLNNPDALAGFRRKHRIADGPIILYVSRLMPANRLDWLVRATAELSCEIEGLKTVIIGNGPDEKRRLQSLAMRIGVQDKVVFLDGIYDEQELAPWFLSATVFCYPANIGLSLIHALWYGLPVVTSDNLASQNPEIVALEPGANGLLYEHGNMSSLVNALRRVLTDPQFRASLSQKALETMENQFTISRMVDGLESAIRFAHQATTASR